MCYPVSASRQNLRPTPVKSHYVFNLRDLARITQGILAMKPYEGMDSGSILPKLFLHEVTRVIGDRLVNTEDKQWLLDKSGEVLSKVRWYMTCLWHVCTVYVLHTHISMLYKPYTYRLRVPGM